MPRKRWITILDIAVDYHAADKDEITVQCLAERIYPQLERVATKLGIADDEVSCLVDDLKAFSNKHRAHKDEFDQLMDSLYDWADRVGVWVATEL